MITIHKFQLQSHGAILLMPIGAKIIHAGRDGSGVLCVWAEVDTQTEKSLRRVQVHGTGHEVAPGAIHVHSWVEGAFVWHLYDYGSAIEAPGLPSIQH